jgi:hypothetical protein
VTEVRTLAVGPGSCNLWGIADSIEKEGSLDESKIKRTMKCFGTSDRPSPEDRSKRIVPGPGMYEVFSEFPGSRN